MVPQMKSQAGTEDADEQHIADIGTADIIEQSTSLRPEHSRYLLHRYGTIDLDPVPDLTEEDPLNWKRWKVRKIGQCERP